MFAQTRVAIIGCFYRWFLKPLFFRFHPETVHDAMTAFGGWLGRRRVLKACTRSLLNYEHPSLRQKIVGITFKNPVGLSAGFDKNGALTSIIPAVGFGFEEVGSVTGEPCQGNAKPRLWRLKRSKALVVYYGLKNDGAAIIASRLSGKEFEVPIGVSIAKTNCAATVDTVAGIADYLAAFRAFVDIADYFTINISCPNAFGGQPFTDAARLEDLLTAVDSVPASQPVFIKLSPDLGKDEIDTIILVALRHRIAGFVCTNLTKNRMNDRIKESVVPDHGGISGKVVEDKSNKLISYVYQKTGGRFVIIGVGGIFSAEDAYVKIKLGASLVQLITGMVYEGPQLIGEINVGLVRLLRADGYENINEAVGKGV